MTAAGLGWIQIFQLSFILIVLRVILRSGRDIVKNGVSGPMLTAGYAYLINPYEPDVLFLGRLFTHTVFNLKDHEKFIHFHYRYFTGKKTTFAA